jgi:anti-sigma factor RsiW
LRRHLRQLREPVPAKFAGRLSTALAVEASDAAVGPERQAVRTKPAGRIVQWIAPRLRQAAVILLAVAISAGTALWMQGTSNNAALSRDALAAHVRSLIQDSPVQVASLDTHVVKPWFAGRIDYAPVVKDLSGDGFQLVGGRLDYVDGQRVAALVYKRRLHQISVFVWPTGARDASLSIAKIDGFNVIGWSKGGMSFRAVSDLNEGELRDLQSLL